MKPETLPRNNRTVYVTDADFKRLDYLLQQRSNWSGLSGLGLSIGGTMILSQIILAFISTQRILTTLVMLIVSGLLLIASGLAYSQYRKATEEIKDLFELVRRR
jgi:hypothetical protein